MGAHVEAGQPHQGHGGQGESAGPRAEPGQGGDAQGDGDGLVPDRYPSPAASRPRPRIPGSSATGRAGAPRS